MTELSALPRPLVAVMSSGFFGFFAHAGFLQGLADQGVEPDAYAGASSGALVAAYAAAGMSPLEMLEGFNRLRRADFWDPPSALQCLRWLMGGLRGRTGWLAGEAFQRRVEESLPCRTFEECPKGCLMVALDLVSNQRVVLTRGLLAPAVRASGAVPLLFAAVPHAGGLLLDGGLVDKAPLVAAARHFHAASLVVHLLPSASLEGPPLGALGKPLAAWRLQRQAIDAARQQHYEDQVESLRQHGVIIEEIVARDLPRLSPARLNQGAEAFAQARRRAFPNKYQLL